MIYDLMGEREENWEEERDTGGRREGSEGDKEGEEKVEMGSR